LSVSTHQAVAKFEAEIKFPDASQRHVGGLLTMKVREHRDILTSISIEPFSFKFRY
jgi:hypothetical protein